ncbi:hypothetical protein DFH94DRAFT_718898, partial [Russula ochroleuca]
MTGTKGCLSQQELFCIPNIWHMNRDPEHFGKDTEHFDPARYLDASGDIALGISDIKEQGHFSYGFCQCFAASVATWQTIPLSSTLLSYYGQPNLNARKTHQAAFFPWFWMAGWIMVVGLIATLHGGSCDACAGT